MGGGRADGEVKITALFPTMGNAEAIDQATS
jgi:hypothetical protein